MCEVVRSESLLSTRAKSWVDHCVWLGLVPQILLFLLSELLQFNELNSSYLEYRVDELDRFRRLLMQMCYVSVRDILRICSTSL